MIVAFIDEHKAVWGTEPICRVLTEDYGLKIAAGTYYAFKNREPSARSKRDAELKKEIMTIHRHRRKRVYGERSRRINGHQNRLDHHRFNPAATPRPE